MLLLKPQNNCRLCCLLGESICNKSVVKDVNVSSKYLQKEEVDAEAKKNKTFCKSFELILSLVFDDICPSHSLEKFCLIVVFF